MPATRTTVGATHWWRSVGRTLLVGLLLAGCRPAPVTRREVDHGTVGLPGESAPADDGALMLVIDSRYCLGCNFVGYHLRRLPDPIRRAVLGVLIVGDSQVGAAALANLRAERTGLGPLRAILSAEGDSLLGGDQLALWRFSNGRWNRQWHGNRIDSLPGLPTGGPSGTPTGADPGPPVPASPSSSPPFNSHSASRIGDQ